MMRTDMRHPLAATLFSSVKMEALQTRVEREVKAGQLPSAQFAIAFEGKLVAFETYGSAPHEALYPIFSATKTVTASLAWQAIESGDLDLNRPVKDWISGFRENGKSAVLVEHLFTHTAGFPNAPFRPTDYWDAEKRQERFKQWRLDWAPGSRFVYHPTSTLWALVEILEQIYQQSFQQLLLDKIASPLALPELFVGCPSSEHSRISRLEHVGVSPTEQDYLSRKLPVPPVTEVTEEVITSYNEKDNRLVPTPGGGGFMSAATLALFYQGLLGYGPDTSDYTESPWKKETVKLARQVRTQGLKDPLLGVPVSRGLGIVIAGTSQRNLRGFGHNNHPLSFGHEGAGGQIAWADPNSGMSFVYLTNGHERNPFIRGRRTVSLCNHAADLVADW